MRLCVCAGPLAGLAKLALGYGNLEGGSSGYFLPEYWAAAGVYTHTEGVTKVFGIERRETHCGGNFGNNWVKLGLCGKMEGWRANNSPHERAQLFQELRDSIAAGGLVSGHCLGGEHGLVEHHAYTILGTAIVGGERLVHLRNTWGSHEWTGKWSDKDTASWTPAAIAQCNADPHNGGGWVDKDDGSFFMSNFHFCRYFGHFSVDIFLPIDAHRRKGAGRGK